ncbi:MAG: ATP-binding protein [Dysosmobacter sp.]
MQAEYEAIQLAMDTLSARQSDHLQNRFSPALGADTARNLLRPDRRTLRQGAAGPDACPSAPSPPATPFPAALALLSQGAGDQLYLAARLAICRMVLPQDKAAPLILDDALANFDDTRMASRRWTGCWRRAAPARSCFSPATEREGDYLWDRAHVVSPELRCFMFLPLNSFENICVCFPADDHLQHRRMDRRDDLSFHRHKPPPVKNADF